MAEEEEQEYQLSESQINGRKKLAKISLNHYI